MLVAAAQAVPVFQDLVLQVVLEEVEAEVLEVITQLDLLVLLILVVAVVLQEELIMMLLVMVARAS
jgi:hypothetical protein